MTVRLTYICDRCDTRGCGDNLFFPPADWTTDAGVGNRVWHYCPICTAKQIERLDSEMPIPKPRLALLPSLHR